MTVSSPHLIENKLDRLIDDMRFLKAQMLRFDQRLKEIEVHGLLSKLSEQQQPESKSRPWTAAAGRAAARTILTLFAVGAGTGAVLHYLGT
jgi:DNA-binding HxlR family transcriptional regulator